MERDIILTEDGSHTIANKSLNATYHSIFGAISESKHVYIEAGLNFFIKQKNPGSLSIFEMGFGTGLNSLLSLIEAENQDIKISYTAIEPYPVSVQQAMLLNYPENLGSPDLEKPFQLLHSSAFNEIVSVSDHFNFKKIDQSITHYQTRDVLDIIFYDAFAPAAQPELWTQEIFYKMFEMLNPGGILTTYCSKGSVRRAMQSAGFQVERIPGPKRKREILRARRFK